MCAMEHILDKKLYEFTVSVPGREKEVVMVLADSILDAFKKVHDCEIHEVRENKCRVIS